jgi:hypothetical protein
MNGDSSLSMSIVLPNPGMDLDCRVKCQSAQSPSPNMILYRYTDSGVPAHRMLTVLMIGDLSIQPLLCLVSVGSPNLH